MSHLILIRHSESDARRDLPSHQWELTTAGHQRAADLASKLGRYAPFAIASSPEPKAWQTAEAIADRHRLKAITDPDLREHDRRTVKWTGSSEEYEAAISRFFGQRDQLVLGEETGRQALDRFSTAIQNLVAKHYDQNLVVVTHGSVITLFAQEYAGVDPVLFWKSLTQPWYCVFSVPELQLQKVVPYQDQGRKS